MAILVRDGRRIRGATLFPRILETGSTGSGSPTATIARTDGVGEIPVQSKTGVTTATTATTSGVGAVGAITGTGTATAATATTSGVGDIPISGSSTSQADTATAVGAGYDDITASGSPQADTATAGSTPLVETSPVSVGFSSAVLIPIQPPYSSSTQTRTNYHNQIRRYLIDFYATKQFAKKSRITTVTTDYAVVDTDDWVAVDSVSPCIISLPPAGLSEGRRLKVQSIGSPGWAVVQADGSDQINEASSISVVVQYSSVDLVCDGIQWWAGGLSSGTVVASTPIPTSKFVSSITTSQTITTNDQIVFCDATAGAITVTLPTAVGNEGQIFEIKKTDASANEVILDGDGSETIEDTTTVTITVQYEAIKIASDGAEWFIL